MDAGKDPGLHGLSGLLGEFPGAQAILDRIGRFQKKLKEARYGMAVRWIQCQNRRSAERAVREGDGIVTVNGIREDGRVDSRTTVEIRSTPEATLRALLEDAWSAWWRHSDVEVFERDGRRVRSFAIYPLGRRIPVRVDIRLAGPRPAGGDGQRTAIPMDVTGSFAGHGRLEVEDLGGGRVRVEMSWPAFEADGVLPALAVVLHGNAMEGEPFAIVGDESHLDGTGFEGLKRYLEAQAA